MSGVKMWMCFPRWETIRNLRRDPTFIWRDPTRQMKVGSHSGHIWDSTLHFYLGKVYPVEK